MKELSLRELQLEEAKILEKTAEFLEENNLTYFLYGGTLIGAIRHKGFIPWDDDIDIVMPRKDYEKFLNITKKLCALPNQPSYKVESMEYTNLKYPICKVINPNIKIDSTSKEDHHLWIDVFPLDGLPENMRKCNKILTKQQRRRIIVHIKYTPIKAILKEHRNLLNRFSKIIFKPICLLIPTKKILSKMSNTAKSNPYEQSFFCGAHAWETTSLPIRMRKSIFSSSVYAEFEGRKYHIPKGYDEYLSCMYGDYMKLPPENQRISHATKAYKID